MLKMIGIYIIYFLMYIYLHVFFIIFIYNFCFSLKTQYYSDINLSYDTILKYKDNFKLNEESFYTSFNLKNTILTVKEPIFQINNTLFFNYNIGISKEVYIKKNSIILDEIPILYSLIPIYQINEFLIKLIHKQYLNYKIICNEVPVITIINKKLISIKSKSACFLVFPWTIISKIDYEEIIKKKITDLRLYYKNKDL